MHTHRKSPIPPHQRGGAYLKDLVYGANDGIITTFAIVAGVAGARLEVSIVLLLGIANLLADGFSMAASNYLGTKSEHAFSARERKTEEQEYHAMPEEEMAEMHGILRKKGYSKEDSFTLGELLRKNKEFWLDIKLKEQLGIDTPNGDESPKRAALATFGAFVGAGVVPLVPYLFASGREGVFALAIVFTATILFVVGALRARFTGRSWYIDGLEMLFVGGVAAAIAYGVGFFVSAITA